MSAPHGMVFHWKRKSGKLSSKLCQHQTNSVIWRSVFLHQSMVGLNLSYRREKRPTQ